MRVLIATDGHVDPTRAAALCAGLVGEDRMVTVLTVVEVPRRMLEEMRAAAAPPTSEVLARVQVEYAHEPIEPPAPGSWMGDAAAIERYVHTCAARATHELVAALERAGLRAEVIARDAENVAGEILAVVDELSVDVLCIGTHGLGRFEGLLGSISTKLVRRAPCSVLLVRPAPAGAHS